MRTLAGVAALGITADVSRLGRARILRMTTAMPDNSPHDRLQPDWYQRKISQVQEKMKERKLNALVLLDATNVIYTTGYFHLHTERPLAALIPESGEPALFVPELESDQVKFWWVKDYESYFDYPGPVNRVRWIFERVARRGFGSGRIGVEEPTPGRMQHMKEGAPKPRSWMPGTWLKICAGSRMKMKFESCAVPCTSPTSPCRRDATSCNTTAESPRTKYSRPPPMPWPTRCRKNSTM